MAGAWELNLGYAKADPVIVIFRVARWNYARGGEVSVNYVMTMRARSSCCGPRDQRVTEASRASAFWQIVRCVTVRQPHILCLPVFRNEASIG